MIDLNLRPLVSEMKAVKEAINSKPTPGLNVDENGFTKYIYNGLNKIIKADKSKI